MNGVRVEYNQILVEKVEKETLKWKNRTIEAMHKLSNCEPNFSW
jgi:hypothetical protein